MFVARQNWGLKWGSRNLYATVTPNGLLILCLNVDSYTNINSYIMYYWRTKNLDVSLKVQGQHLVWYFCSSQAGISSEIVDLTAAVRSWNICRLELHFLLFPFNSWQKKMPIADDEKIHSDQNYTKNPLHMTAVPILYPTQPLYNGI